VVLLFATPNRPICVAMGDWRANDRQARGDLRSTPQIDHAGLRAISRSFATGPSGVL
jgi:hypothetical protein